MKTRSRTGVTLMVGILVAAFLLIGGMAALSSSAKRPANLGIHDGQLLACPTTPNCVASQSGTSNQRMPPLKFDGDAATAKSRLKEVIAGMPRLKVVSELEDYLHVEATSQVFGFVDDVEFQIDTEARQIHFRSASRVGHSDMNANRARMLEITNRFEALSTKP